MSSRFEVMFHIRTLQCTIPYDSRNEHSVSYDMDSRGPANPRIPTYTIYILTGVSYDMDS